MLPQHYGAMYTKITRIPCSNLPWFLNDPKKVFSTRDTIKQAKSTGLPNYLSKYKYLQNKVTSMLHSAKRQYINDLDMSIAKPFGRQLINNSQKITFVVPSLDHNGSAIIDDQEKAEIFIPSLLNVSIPPYIHS